ncbi:MAG: DMT family transporter [Magnetovibrio sp.]|nr:DMT family transporter [Magnetovibrio sp.]
MTTETSPTLTSASRTNDMWLVAMPGVFVLLWSTGFIGAKLGLPYAEPFTFLFLRFAALTVILVSVALIFRAPWPCDFPAFGRVALVGLLVHGGYLGGVFSAIAVGMPAGVIALIVGLQPILSAVGAGMFLGEKVTRRQWVGLVLGLMGVALVLGDKLTLSIDSFAAPVMALFALMCITVGTIYQKRHGDAMDLRSGSAIQFAAAGIPTGICALLFETREVVWSGEFVFALTWLVLVLSIGAISLLFVLIRRGAVAKVTSLFYLTPAVTALIAWGLFDETLQPLAIVGMVVVITAVALVTIKKT